MAAIVNIPRQWLSLLLVLAGALGVPAGLRAVNTLLPGAAIEPSYLPTIEPPRARQPFDEDAVARLQGARPEFIIIGDSMAGTRVKPEHLSRIVGPTAALLHPGTGSAYWYLAFKNLVVNANIRPKAVIFFFRDNNLTEPLFRYYPGSLDRVARRHEAALDRLLAAATHGPFHRVHALSRSIYRFDRTRDWLEPWLNRLPVSAAAPGAEPQAFLQHMNDSLFSLNALRKMAAADMQQVDAATLDFDARLPGSVLPEIVRLSRSSGIRVAFVRVQRRPAPNGPPPQSPALMRYVRDLTAYLTAEGAYVRDDWGDPDQPLSIYEDGDHIDESFRLRYTELFAAKNPDLFR
jgi:hypothetical protein